MRMCAVVCACRRVPVRGACAVCLCVCGVPVQRVGACAPVAAATKERPAAAACPYERTAVPRGTGGATFCESAKAALPFRLFRRHTLLRCPYDATLSLPLPLPLPASLCRPLPPSLPPSLPLAFSLPLDVALPPS
eukprot:7385430-Prymnesium_polylepis.2